MDTGREARKGRNQDHRPTATRPIRKQHALPSYPKNQVRTHPNPNRPMKKPSHRSYRSFLPAGTAVLSMLLSVSPVGAASFYWDASGNAADSSYGGDGTWNSTNTLWNDSATIGSGTALTSWNDAASPLDTANFLRGTSGTVTVSGTRTLLSVSFGTSAGSFTSGSAAYTVTGGILDIRQASYSNAINNNNGSNTIESDVYLFGAMTAAGSNRQRLVIGSGSLSLGNLQDISGYSGTHELSLENYSAALNINGNITKSTNSSGMTLLVGGTSTSNTASYTLGGNNTGLTGVATVTRGTLVLNNTNALVGATSVTVANANSGTADTAAILIGTAGVTINKAITFSTLGTDTTDIRSIGGSNTSGTATYSGTITTDAFAASGTGASLRVTSATGGTVDFSGNITDGSASVALLLNGSGTVRFTRAAGMNYDGGTTVSSGSFLVNNTTGSGTGTGAVLVGSTATLGGSGIIAGNTTLASGSFLAAGSASGATGTLTFNGSLDISGLASGTGGLLFDLGATGSSDKISLSAGALSIGTGALNFNDFAFIAVSGFGAGTYTLFETSTSIVGTLGSSLTGTISGLDAAISLSGNSVILTVTAIPESSSFAAMLGVAAIGAAALPRRQRR